VQTNDDGNAVGIYGVDEGNSQIHEGNQTFQITEYGRPVTSHTSNVVVVVVVKQHLSPQQQSCSNMDREQQGEPANLRISTNTNSP
jgi:hypothetical protein